MGDANPLTQRRGELGGFRLERVLYVDVPGRELWAIDVGDANAWPVPHKLDELSASVAADKARIVVGHEPHPVISLTDEELGVDFAKQIAYRDAAWKLIEPLLRIEARKVFSRRIRGPLIAEIARKSGRDKSKVRFQLRRYWQRGCTKNALFPDWHKRGLKGTETPGAKKRGRPTIERDENGQAVGVNVTESDEQIFKKGIDRYVVSGTASAPPHKK